MFWIILLGIATGMRTMTPIAVFCWFTWLALIPVTSFTRWTAYLASVIVFTIFALGEYYGDTLARTPKRTSAFPLVARIFFGVLVGVLVASTFHEPIVTGVLFGGIGALLGAFGGYRLRVWGAKLIGADLPVAIGESMLAIVLSIASMYYIGNYLRWDNTHALSHSTRSVLMARSPLHETFTLPVTSSAHPQ